MGTTEDVADVKMHQRFALALFDETGFDLHGWSFDHFFRVDVLGAAAVEVGAGHLDVTTWRSGSDEHVIRKH